MDVTKEDIQRVSKSFDSRAQPCLDFTLTEEGGKRMWQLTKRYQPQDNRNHLLGIVINGELHSALRLNEPIRTNGQITGDFTTEEIDAFMEAFGSLGHRFRLTSVNNNVGQASSLSLRKRMTGKMPAPRLAAHYPPIHRA